MKNPFQDRDLHTTLLFPTLSWSSYNAFVDYDKAEWYNKYVLGIRGLVNASMEAGRIIGERLATDPSYLPEVPRPAEYEVELTATFGGIDIIGHLDGFSMKKNKKLFEYKTSLSGKRWTAVSVNNHEQIDMYCLLIWLNYKFRPEDLKIQLVYIPVKQLGSFEIVRDEAQPIQIINTKRTMADILRFGVKLKKAHKEMNAYIDTMRANGL